MICLKRLLVVSVCFLALTFGAGSLYAQETSIFGGYSYVRDLDVDVSRQGWNGALALGFTPRFQIVIDASGHYSTMEGTTLDESLYTIQAGPQLLLAPGAALQPFVRGMIGAGRFARSPNVDWGMTFVAGGGLDWRISDGAAIRLIQADYLVLRKPDEFTAHTVRLSAGLMLVFGE